MNFGYALDNKHYNFLNQLATHLSYNLFIIQAPMEFYGKEFDELNETIKKCLQRNQSLDNARTQIAEIKGMLAPQLHKNIVSNLITSALKEIEQALVLSQQIGKQFPKSHTNCVAYCDGLKNEIEQLNNRILQPKENKAANVLQNYSRSFLVLSAYDQSRKDKATNLEQQNDFITSLAENQQYGLLEEFAAAMKVKDYTVALKLMQKVQNDSPDSALLLLQPRA